MRVIISVVKDKMETDAPSEPALAIAAAIALNAKKENYPLALKLLLDELIIQGLVLERGAKGELCTRLLFILARDYATMTSHKRYLGLNPLRVLSINLGEFFDALFGSDYGHKVPKPRRS